MYDYAQLTETIVRKVDLISLITPFQAWIYQLAVNENSPCMEVIMTEPDLTALRQQFINTRKLSEDLTGLLTHEDHMLQSMPDASPTKWHLAHTSWFFDTFILKPRQLSCQKASYEHLFNSYYNQVGPQYTRAQRGLISRPGLDEVWDFRRAVEHQLDTVWDTLTPAESALVELGIHHEQQHQELIVTDIKHALSYNPEHPALIERNYLAPAAPELLWHDFVEGDYEVGCATGFCFDNEMPRHRVHLGGFRLASRAVTNGEYLAFIEDQGYQCPAHWLSEGWAWVNSTRARAPLYWQQIDNQWFTYSLSGFAPINLPEPVCHLNYFEANAFANWSGKRLPTEFEWEVAAAHADPRCRVLDLNVLHPRTAVAGEQLQPLQMFGDVWEWTQSAYLPYPEFQVAQGAVGEYNGKFMVNQWVLRGGSCATPAGHIRASYRNFFPVNANWQFSGVRLADDLK